MSEYIDHARRHAPGGSDPIQAGGIDACFVVKKTGTQTITDTSTAPVTFSSTILSIGSPITTATSNTYFLLATGVWLLGVRVHWQATSVAADGTWRLRLRDNVTTNVLATAWSAEDPVAGGNAIDTSMELTYVWDARTDAIELYADVINNLGYSLFSDSGGTATYMWGVRIMT